MESSFIVTLLDYVGVYTIITILCEYKGGY